MARLSDKIAIVTGGSRGMGAATVRQFVREGAKVVIADLLPEGEALARELGSSVLFHRTDISSEADWQALLTATESAFGTPDILVNNAAMQRFRSILECEVDDFRKVVDVNLVGAFLGLKVVGGAMVRQRRGSIINISSVDGMRGANGYAAYSASKWGVRGLTKVAAMEFGPRGVRVNSVHPGGVHTVMGNPTGAAVEDIDKGFGMVPAQRSGQPDEIAAATLFLASDEASYIMGAELAVDGGWTAGIYNQMLSGAPEDADYGARTAAHDINKVLDDALRAKAGN
ncbi:SDR family NAD(P)-dependent oxidoreductase [Novosphingobium sp. Chol11]|uniref:SDR family NAD(P)-dependent oxidoreductase n=1 Tax=Novosphingobium sp. Chol11 TaxID=1385763 RepID=UPI000BE4637C|nr:glucose 1-dehydrogenase [Novosphingobium sp. Chol11]